MPTENSNSQVANKLETPWLKTKMTKITKNSVQNTT